MIQVIIITYIFLIYFFGFILIFKIYSFAFLLKIMFLINLHISSLKLSSIYQSYIYSFLLNLLYFQKNNEKKINFSNLYIQEKRIEITAEIVFLFHYISIVILLFCSFFYHCVIKHYSTFLVSTYNS